MRRAALVWWGLVLSMAGCSLDIGRLYGDAEMLDGGRDAPSMDVGVDAAALDVGDAPLPDAPVSPSALSVRDSYSLEAPATFVAAGRAGGVTRIAITAVSTGELAILGVTGEGCDLRLAEGRNINTGFAGPVAVGSLDADGEPDVVAAPTSMLTAFVGPAASALVSSPHPLRPLLALDVGSFDTDAVVDLLLVEDGGETLIGRGDGEGRFGTFIDPNPVTANVDGALGDLDGDGSLDVIRLDILGGDHRVLVTRGDGTGGFFGPLSAIVHDDALQVTVGATAGARPLAFVVGGTSMFVVGAVGASLNALGPMTVATDARDVVLADLDGVPPREVVVSDGTSGLLHVLRWGGMAVEDLGAFPILGVPTGLAAVDADGDGDDEILVLVGDGVQLLSTGCDP